MAQISDDEEVGARHSRRWSPGGRLGCEAQYPGASQFGGGLRHVAAHERSAGGAAGGLVAFPVCFRGRTRNCPQVLLMGSSRRAEVLAVMPQAQTSRGRGFGQGEKARIGSALPAETAVAMGMGGEARVFEPPAREGQVSGRQARTCAGGRQADPEVVETVPEAAVEPEAAAAEDGSEQSTSEEEVEVGERAIAPRDSVEQASVAEGPDDPEPMPTVAEPGDDPDPQDGSPLVEVRGGSGVWLKLRKLESWTPG